MTSRSSSGVLHDAAAVRRWCGAGAGACAVIDTGFARSTPAPGSVVEVTQDN
jgi:hypothetical protein